MKLKLDDQGHAVLQDGKPVYVKDDGSEMAFDAAQTTATISRLNGEAKSHRERAEAAETSLKQFEGIEDPVAALKAIETMKDVDAGNLIKNDKLEEVKQAVEKSVEERYQGQIKQLNTALQQYETQTGELTQQLHKELIGGGFANSKFVNDKIAVPSDMVQATFGKNFKVEDGKRVAYGNDGQPIYSKTRMGELADFDEALEILVDNYPHKDSILKASDANGGGAPNNGGGRPPANKGNFGGSREERTAAIGSRFPELPER
ncbi:DUF6651 domain-containing protein [Vreelandella populi]|uniref:DUF6651 domain-containing protein n=1 Tax=Vreelandella populi TaxID=2498858 RepID=UPI000F8E5DEF|nr:DUF6651 domain-containing protein [Halomonas populi]RUR38544.1 hypothetical protein ELY25_09280 [Halomonas populi]